MNIFEISGKDTNDREKPVIIGRVRAVDADEAMEQAREMFNLTGYRMLIAKFVEEESM